MLPYFWSDGSAIPQSLYTANFSPAHIAWVLTVLLLMPAIVCIYRLRTAAVRVRIKKGLALVMLLCEASSWLWQALTGAFTVQYSLPLQLCDISVFLEFAAVYAKRAALLREFSYALSMPAAFAAVVTPGWYYPFLTYGYLKMALMHALLILIPVLLVWGDGVRPDYRRLLQVSPLFVLFIAIAVTANTFLGSNYMFLAYVPRDTALAVFESWFGNPGYVLPELFLLLLIWTVLYLPWTAPEHRARSG
ncbi:conserved hypothetical integral membrane protein TIGR02206 [Sporobacter termitidis DSM 10068]|uniref:Conserved hypothetical integral membrane protein TIGR02206 n=1 Tax=Sporobacter termitidis DSM 10068 TaxID=1123282 RepID=A0A1M5YF77_9FIRM|nr:TIGR02206 family membrane protein [Sporobacter termitidis]SHI10602.1 conserved hypothetical integral membrane protein TIGR02206 [Sporobacter termitidis DSM 10068]